jgi:hypothetical protein
MRDADGYPLLLRKVGYTHGDMIPSGYEEVTETLYRKVSSTCIYCEMGDTPDRVPHDCKAIEKLFVTYEKVTA